MILAYGSHTHDANECAVVRTLDRELNAANQTLSAKRRWAIRGQLQEDTQALLIAARKTLEAAYAKQDEDLILYLDDGTTIFDAMRSRGSTSGVLIKSGPNYPIGDGAEGATFLTYEIIVEADYEFSADGASLGGQAGESSDPERLESWSETVTATGGGPRYVMIDVVNGPPVRQLLNSQTKTRITQQGSATGRKVYPSPPAPLYPDWNNPAEQQVSQTSPRQEGKGATGYTTTWSYVMEGPGIGGQKPNLWPL